MKTKKIYLNGDWDFIPTDGSEGGKVYVPSMWSHGAPWGCPKEREDVEEAWLERDIEVPKDWEDSDIIIRFEAVAFKAEVYLDEKKIGEHIGGFMPFDFILPLKAGEKSKLRVLVTGVSAVQDGFALFHPVSYPEGHEEGVVARGIWQNVLLQAVPKTSIKKWEYTFDGDSIKLSVSAKASSWSVRGILSHDIIPLEEGKGTVVLSAENLERWSHRNPVLHEIELLAHDEDGKICHSLPVRIGLKTVHIEDDNIYLNENPIHLFGFSMVRHRISPNLWRRDYLELYLKTMQDIGYNCVRVHGCIGPSIIYDICDEIGMLVDAQSSMWSAAEKAYMAAGQVFIDNAMNELTEWIQRDKHHPSIILWDTENELYRINQAWDKVGELFIDHIRELDPTRPVFASGAGSWEHGDIIHNHCENSLSNVIETQLKTAEENPKTKRPFIAGEWWGDTVRRGTGCFQKKGLSNNFRQPFDFSSQKDIDKTIGLWHAEEIRRHRIMGICGTFPFALEVFIFDKLFEQNAKILVPESKENPVRIDMIGDLDETQWVDVRRTYVNPSWDSSLPAYKLNPQVVEQIKAAFNPILIDVLEEGCSLYAEQDNKITLVICNDSDIKLADKLTVFVAEKKLNALAVEVLPCSQQRITINIQPEKNQEKIELSVKLGSASELEKIRDWQVYSAPLKRKQSIAVTGIDEETKEALVNRQMELIFTNEAPEINTPWIIADGNGLSRDEVENFISSGGKVLLLRQERQPSCLQVGLFLESALLVNHNVSIGYGLKQISRERSGILSLSMLSDFFKNITSEELGPWQGGRVADASWLWEDLDCGRNVRGFVAGKTAEEYTVLDISFGSGKALLSQLCLSENLGKEAQADIAFDALLDWCFEKQNASKIVECDKSKDLTLLQEKIGPFDDEGTCGLKIIGDPNKFNEENIQSFLNTGGQVLCLLEELHADWKTKTIEEHTIAFQKRPLLLQGLTSSHLDGIPATKKGLINLPDDWSSAVQIFSWLESSEKGGMILGGEEATLIAHKKHGKGDCYITMLSMKDLLQAKEFSSILMSNAGLLSKRELSEVSEDPIVLAKRTPALPLDGDYWKWRSLEADKVISPWVLAEPIHYALKNKEDKRDFGGVGYVLYDDEYLYVSSSIVATKNHFSDNPDVWNNTNLEVFIGATQIIVSQDEVGKAMYYINGVQVERDELRSKIHVHDDLQEWPDLQSLGINTDLDLKTCFIELAVPWSSLSIDKPKDKTESFQIALGITSAFDAEHPQVAMSKFPAKYKNMSLPTYAKCILEE